MKSDLPKNYISTLERKGAVSGMLRLFYFLLSFPRIIPSVSQLHYSNNKLLFNILTRISYGFFLIVRNTTFLRLIYKNKLEEN